MPASPATARGPSGRWVVSGMFLFAAAVVGGFWLYWGLANRPFADLQRAILAEFPDAVPQVIGGRENLSDAAEPQTLRIVLRVADFDPREDVGRAGETADRLEVLAWRSLDRNEYGRLEIVLFRTYKESRSAYWRRVRDLTTGELIQDESPITDSTAAAAARPESATPAASARI